MQYLIFTHNIKLRMATELEPFTFISVRYQRFIILLMPIWSWEGWNLLAVPNRLRPNGEVLMKVNYRELFCAGRRINCMRNRFLLLILVSAVPHVPPFAARPQQLCWRICLWNMSFVERTEMIARDLEWIRLFTLSSLGSEFLIILKCFLLV